MAAAQPELVMRERPDWDAAAQSLVDGCISLETPELRVRFMDRVCLALGDQLYPAFLRLLCMVSDQGDDQARAAVASTLVHALSTGRIPSGRLNAWGMSGNGTGTEGRTSGGHTRSLGPIEYLCAWHAQQSGPAPLPLASFDTAARSMISLVGADPQAQALYCAKLRQDIDDPLGGSLSRSTRSALSALVSAWEQGLPTDRVVQALLDELHGSSLSTLSRATAHWAQLR
jgi:hypothetical protein